MGLRTGGHDLYSASDGGFFVVEPGFAKNSDSAQIWVQKFNDAGVKEWEKVCNTGSGLAVPTGGKLAVLKDTGGRKVILEFFTLDKNAGCN